MCIIVVVERIYHAFDFKAFAGFFAYHTCVNARVCIRGNICTDECVIKVIGIVCCSCNKFKFVNIALCVFRNKDDVTHFNVVVFIGVNNICYHATCFAACDLCCDFVTGSYFGNLCYDNRVVSVCCCSNTVSNYNSVDIFVSLAVSNEYIAVTVYEEIAYCACFHCIRKVRFGVINKERNFLACDIVVAVCASLFVVFLAVFCSILCLLVELVISAGHIDFADYACRRNLNSCNAYIAVNIISVGEFCLVKCKVVINNLRCYVFVNVANMVNILHLRRLKGIGLNLAFFSDCLNKICCLRKLCLCIIVCDEDIVTACNTACYCRVCYLALIVKIERTVVAYRKVFCKSRRKLIGIIVDVVFAFEIINFVNYALYNIA